VILDRLPIIGNDSDEKEDIDRNQTEVSGETGDNTDNNSLSKDSESGKLTEEIREGEEYLDGNRDNAPTVPPNKELFDQPDDFEQHFDEELKKKRSKESVDGSSNSDTEKQGSSNNHNAESSGDETKEDSSSSTYEDTKFYPADVQPASNEGATEENRKNDRPGTRNEPEDSDEGTEETLSKEDIEDLDNDGPNNGMGR
jgi:hypothetical protein